MRLHVQIGNLIRLEVGGAPRPPTVLSEVSPRMHPTGGGQGARAAYRATKSLMKARGDG